MIEEEEMFNLRDVVSLFINTPTDKALEVILKDSKLKYRIKSLVSDIMELLKFVLTKTYILFHGKKLEFLEQHAFATAPVTSAPRL